MLLAIDLGNTQATFGLHDGVRWLHVWRLSTRVETSEDELGAWFHSLMERFGVEEKIEQIVVASVVPALDRTIRSFGEKFFERTPLKILPSMDLGIEVLYEPVASLGPDRLANALGALTFLHPPLIVIDFGTATTFDVVDREGRFLGGAILPGPEVSAQNLAARTARLPQIELKAPPTAIGRNTVHGLQSGLVLAYAGGVETLARKMIEELGPQTRVVATGGHGAEFTLLCPVIEEYRPHLTLEGLRIASERLARN